MGNFFEDTDERLFYLSISRKYYEIDRENLHFLPAVKCPWHEILLMTNGGIYPIIARRIEKMEAKDNA